MADRDVEIKVRITEEGFRALGVAGKDFDVIRANASAATAAVTGLGQSLLGGVAGGAVVAGIGAVSSALASLPRFLTDSVQAAAEAARAQGQLINSLRNTGQLSAGYVSALNAQAQAQSRVSTFTDEAVSGIQRQLVLFGASRAEVQRLTPIVLDLAVATDRDLGSALLAVTKYSQGNVDAFTRLGLRFDENATQGEKLAKVNEFLARTQGAARTEAASLGGQLTNLSKEWGELQGTTGRWLSALLDLPERIGRVKEAIQTLASGPSEFDQEVARLTPGGGGGRGNPFLDRAAIENQAANTIAARRAQAADFRAAEEQSLLIRRAQQGDAAALTQLDALAVNAPSLRDRTEYQSLPRASSFNADEQAARDFDRENESQKLRAEEAKKAAAEQESIRSKARQAQNDADRKREQALMQEYDLVKSAADARLLIAQQDVALAEQKLGQAEYLQRSERELAAIANEVLAARQAELGARLDGLNIEIQYGTESEKQRALAEQTLLIKREQAAQQADQYRVEQDQSRRRADEQQQQQGRARQAAYFARDLGSIRNADDATRVVGYYGARASSELIGRLYTTTASSLGGTTGATDSSSTIAGAGAAGGVGAAGYAAIAAAVIGGTIEALERSSAEKKRFGATDASVLSEAQYGAISGAFEAVGFGGIGKGLGKLGQSSPAAGAAIDFIFTGGLSTILGAAGAFQAPKRSTQVKDYLEDEVRKESPFFPLQQDIRRGGHTGIDTKLFELPVTEAERRRFEGLGFDQIHSIGSLERANTIVDAERLRTTGFSNPGGTSTSKWALGTDIAMGALGLPTGGGGLFSMLFGNQGPRPGTPDQRAAEEIYEQLYRQEQQGVSNLRFTSGLGLSQVIFGNSGKSSDVQIGTNAITNNLLGVGINAKEARQEIRALADDFGVTLPNAFLELRKQGLEGNIESVEQFTAGLRGVADLFRDDLPRGVDIAGIALKNMFEGANGNIIFNARGALEDIEKRINEIAAAEARVANATQFATDLTGPGGVRDALREDIFNIRASTLRGRRQEQFLQSRNDTRTQAGLNALAMLDRLGDTTLLNPEQQRLAGQSFDSARAAIVGNIDLAAQRYGEGTARYNQAVQPYLAQLQQLDTYSTMLADDADRMIKAEQANTDRIVAAIEKANQQNATGEGTGTQQIELTLNYGNIDDAIDRYMISPRGVQRIQQGQTQ